MIMGEDNLKSLHKWKNFEVLYNHEIYVYPRVSNEQEFRFKNPKVHLIDAHCWNFFYFYSKKTLKKEEHPAIITFKVWEYIDHNNFL
jgi:nicotinate-nucleotide adenylyltransferase